MTEIDEKKIHYAGFSRRLFALLIEAVIVMLAAGTTLLLQSATSQKIAGIVIAFLLTAYEIYFHAKWGQTLGKMATGIKVLRLDFTPIDLRTSFVRSSVGLSFLIVNSLLAIGALWKIGAFSGEVLSREMIESELKGMSLYRLTDSLSTLWVLSEPVVLLFNEKKRAIHDFIAGTVVVVAQRSQRT